MKSVIPILLFFWTSIALSAVPPDTDYRKLLKTLENSLLEGNNRALRDLGSLLDNPEVKNKARRLIDRYTLFRSDEFVMLSNRHVAMAARYTSTLNDWST